MKGSISEEYRNHADFSKVFGKSECDKLIIAGNRTDKKNVAEKVWAALDRSREEGRLSFSFQRNSSDFEVFIHHDRSRFGIDIESAEFEFNFENRLRGCIYNEAIASEAGHNVLGRIPEIRDTLTSRLRSRYDSILFRIVSDGKFRQLPYNEGVSWVRDYDFPSSLYRVGMESYFEDPHSPTREEFLLAITLENINASTPKEIAAVEAAQLHIQSQSYHTDPCAA